MNIAKFSVEHSLFANLLSVIILLGGIVAFSRMPREAFPNVEFEVVTVQTVLRGATAKEVEKLITIPIEDELREVDGIDELSSVSLEGLSMVIIQLDASLDSMDRVVSDIQRAVDRVPDLPRDAEDPIVKELQTRDQPILIVSLTGPDLWGVRASAEALEDWLEDVPGVARVDKPSWRETQIWVEVEPKELIAYHLSFDEIMRALDARNTNLPGGKIYIDGEQHVIRTLGEFESPQEVASVIIRANDRGHWLTVGDVARVRYALEENNRIEKTDGKSAVNLVVVKKDEADTLRLVKVLKREIARFEQQLSTELQVTVIEDRTLRYIRRRLSILLNNGAVGLVLVLGVLVMFLGPRVAALTAIGIPLSFCMTGIGMLGLGISVNLIAMFGLIIALGMVVDDAIVIAENSFRHIERGMPPRQAAIVGTTEVTRPVTATILTSVIAFAPLMYMTGTIGKFIWVIPVVVIMTLLASLFEALVILPSHIADFGRSVSSRQAGRFHRAGQSRWFRSFRRQYMRLLKQALRWRGWVLAGVILMFIGSMVLGATAMKYVNFPLRGVEIFFVRAEAPSGTSLEQVEERMRPIEEALGRLPSEELEHFITTIGTHTEGRGADRGQRRGTHLGQIQVYLTSASARRRDAETIMEELRQAIGTLPGLEVSFQKMRAGPPVGKPVEIHIRGESFETLERIAEEYKRVLADVAGVRDIRDNYEPGKPELQVVVDEQAARRAGLGIQQIGRTIRYAYEGGRATSIKRTNEEVDVLVRFPEGSRHDLAALNELVVENARGDLVPLKRVASFVQAPGVSYVNHLDYKRAVTVTASLDEDVVTALEVGRLLGERFADLPERYPGYSVRYGGEQEETEESMRNLRTAFLFAILAIYCILAISFNSLAQPFIVLLAVPFGLIGVILAFFLHGLPLSFMALLGVVGLAGVVINDSIILVDFINRMSRGTSRTRAILRAGRLRFRPVVLTTISTFVALAPVAYGIGGLDPFLHPAAMAITWGLVCATVLTLVFIPCLYAIEEDVRRWVAASWPRVVRRTQLALARKTG